MVGSEIRSECPISSQNILDGWQGECVGSQERSLSAMRESSVGLSSAEGIKEIRGSNWALILETRK